MDRFQLMTVFVAVAEEESFAGGARRLSMSPPAVTRAIAMLETRLGVKLLTRTTRHVRATDAGLRYLDSARRILADTEEADEAAAGIHAAPRGQLAVTAPVLFGSMFVTPAIVGYLERYPDVTLNAVFLDRVVNLLEEGLDVGVRIGELPDSSMRAIPVGHVRRVVCAAPDYLACHGEPDEPQALAGHRLINASTVSPASEWRFGNASNGRSVRARVKLRCIFGGLPSRTCIGMSTGASPSKSSLTTSCRASVASPSTAYGARSRRQNDSNNGKSPGITASK